MKTRVIVFPFDLFGSAGTGAGAELVGDAVHEMLQDAVDETIPNRAECYQSNVAISEYTFDMLAQCNHWRETAQRGHQEFVERNEFLIWLLGNHLGVLPIYEELGEETLVLQFDAHLDVYNLSDCTEELSHGNFLMHTDKPLPKIINIGSRDFFLAPDHAKQYFHTIHSAMDIATDPQQIITQVIAATKKSKRVWIDLDCDAFDPAFFPAVQHPQPFGLTPAFVLGLLQTIWSKKVVGVSISEFDPGRDRNDQSLSTLIWLLEWLLLRASGDPGK